MLILMIDSWEWWRKNFLSCFCCELERISIVYSSISKEARPRSVATCSHESRSLKLPTGPMDSDEGNFTYILWWFICSISVLRYGPVMGLKNRATWIGEVVFNWINHWMPLFIKLLELQMKWHVTTLKKVTTCILKARISKAHHGEVNWVTFGCRW